MWHGKGGGGADREREREREIERERERDRKGGLREGECLTIYLIFYVGQVSFTIN